MRGRHKKEAKKEALAEDVEMFRMALEAARAGAWKWDIATNRTVWSDENYRLFGIEPGSVESNYDNWLGFVHPEDRAFCDEHVKLAVNERSPLDMEYRVVWPDGSVRWMHDIGRIMLGDDEEPVGMFGLQVDVTERKEAEEKLHRKIDELEKWQRLTASREMKMIDLKKEIKSLRQMRRKTEKKQNPAG